MRKICCIFNYNPHYRFPIYREMDLKLNCDFFFGNKVEGTIKQFNPLLLKGFKSYISSHKIKLFPLYYKKKLLWIVVLLHTNIKNIFSKKYDTYLITGQTNMLINWLILVYAKITNKKVYAWGHGLIRKISNPLMPATKKSIMDKATT